MADPKDVILRIGPGIDLIFDSIEKLIEFEKERARIQREIERLSEELGRPPGNQEQ